MKKEEKKQREKGETVPLRQQHYGAVISEEQGFFSGSDVLVRAQYRL